MFFKEKTVFIHLFFIISFSFFSPNILWHELWFTIHVKGYGKITDVWMRLTDISYSFIRPIIRLIKPQLEVNSHYSNAVYCFRDLLEDSIFLGSYNVIFLDSWAKLFFFLLGDSFTWAISAVSNSFPAHPGPPGSVIGGDSSLSVMHGPAHQSKFVVLPLQSDTGGPSVLIQPVWRRRGWRGKKEWCREGQKLSPCSSRNIFGTALWQEGRLCPNRLSGFDAKAKLRYTRRKPDLSRW